MGQATGGAEAIRTGARAEKKGNRSSNADDNANPTPQDIVTKEPGKVCCPGPPGMLAEGRDPVGPWLWAQKRAARETNGELVHAARPNVSVPEVGCILDICPIWR
jgi:hypothetical protein